jgi:hypothetical protein
VHPNKPWPHLFNGVLFNCPPLFQKLKADLGPSVFSVFLSLLGLHTNPIHTLELSPTFTGTRVAQGPLPGAAARRRRQELLQPWSRQQETSRLVLGLPATGGSRNFVQRARPPRAGSRPTSAQGRRQGRHHPTSCSLHP